MLLPPTSLASIADQSSDDATGSIHHPDDTAVGKEERSVEAKGQALRIGQRYLRSLLSITTLRSVVRQTTLAGADDHFNFGQNG